MYFEGIIKKRSAVCEKSIKHLAHNNQTGTGLSKDRDSPTTKHAGWYKMLVARSALYVETGKTKPRKSCSAPSSDNNHFLRGGSEGVDRPGPPW